jgi:hypothetical protein
LGEVGFVAHGHEAGPGKIVEQFPELADVKAGPQKRIDADFLLQKFAGDFRCLTRARKGTGDDDGRDLEPGEQLCDRGDLVLALVGQRPFVVGLVPVRPIGFAMAKEKKFHWVRLTVRTLQRHLILGHVMAAKL